MNVEIWKPIKGYEGLYEISNLGRLKKLEKKWVAGKGSVRFAEESITLGILNSHGYYTFDLCKNGNPKKTKIHRLVAEHFLEKEINKKIVNHIDGDKSNNRATNLEWTTSKINNEHAYAVGLRKTKLTTVEIKEMRNFYDDNLYTTYELAQLYGISQSNVWNIVKRKTWRYVEE